MDLTLQESNPNTGVTQDIPRVATLQITKPDGAIIG